jgi:hypothetical protein
MRPYVGITGATTIEEIDFIAEEFEKEGFQGLNISHEPMIGFLVSSKTLQGESSSAHATRYPPIKELGKLLSHAKKKGLFTAIHYTTRDQKTLADQVKKVLNKHYFNEVCDTVQLNIAWPALYEFKKIPFYYKKIFQANATSMDNKTPDEFANKLGPYAEELEYVLFDPSGGLGREFKIENLHPFYSKIKETYPAVKLGFAGGFSGENLERRLKEIFATTKSYDFSIDAEGKLRTDDDSRIGREKAKEYIAASRQLLNHKL